MNMGSKVYILQREHMIPPVRRLTLEDRPLPVKKLPHPEVMVV